MRSIRRPDDDAQRCLRAYEAELNERFDAGFDVDSALPLPADELRAAGRAASWSPTATARPSAAAG